MSDNLTAGYPVDYIYLGTVLNIGIEPLTTQKREV